MWAGFEIDEGEKAASACWPVYINASQLWREGIERLKHGNLSVSGLTVAYSTAMITTVQSLM